MPLFSNPIDANRTSVKGRPGVYYVQNTDHGSHKKKGTPITVTLDVYTLKCIPSFWCVNLAWSYLPGRRLDFFLDSVYSKPVQTGFSKVGCKLRHVCNKLSAF